LLFSIISTKGWKESKGGKNTQVGKEVIKKSMVWILIALAGYMSSLASPLLNQPKVRRVVREDIPARAPIRIQTF